MREPGLPVEIGGINSALGRLWESSGDTKTRASLINLVIYTEDEAAMDANTDLLCEIASRHAFRAILILANPGTLTSGACAWISAHCHLSGKGGRQICSEQITFRLDGESAAALPNIVFSHLDSDLPLCFWSQAEFREPLDVGLWSWVDRLIFDSATWKDPAEQFALTQKIRSLGDGAAVLCDLSWTRLQPWRQAIANVFDHSAALARLPEVRFVRIACGVGERVEALLLLGWLASRLGWIPETSGWSPRFSSPAASPVSTEISPAEGAGVSLVEIGGVGFAIRIERVPGSDFFHVRLCLPGMEDGNLTMGAVRDRPGDTLLAELGRGGRHPLYAKSLEIVRALLAG